MLLCYFFLVWCSEGDFVDLWWLCSFFLLVKEFYGVDGFEVSDEVVVVVVV